MSTVFLAGSINIKKLHPKFMERLDSLIDSGLQIVVGDATGADSAIQKRLKDRGTDRVTVYCSGTTPRHNYGEWSIRSVATLAAPGSRAFFGAKDLEMAAIADFGLMLWDAKSTGTLNNVIELLRRRKKCVVFVSTIEKFAVVSDASTLKDLVEVMPDEARIEAEDKISLGRKLEALKNQQLDLSL